MATTTLIEHQRPSLAPQGHYLPGILDDYLAGQLTEGTKRIYQRDIRDFFDGQVPTLAQLKALCPNDLIAWRNLRWTGNGGNLEASTVNRKLTAIKTFFDYLIGMGVVDYNPCSAKVVKRIRVKAWQPQLGLTIEEIKALLVAAQKDDNQEAGRRDHALISLGYASLMRRDELSKAKWRDLRKDGGRVVLHLPFTKGGAHDTLPIEQQNLALLDKYFNEIGVDAWRIGWQKINPKQTWNADKILECPIFIAMDNRCFGQQLSGSGVNEIVKKRAKQAGLISDIHAHTLRHSGITHLLEHGVPLPKVQELARHSDPKITMRYHTLLGKMKDSPTNILAGNLS